MTDFVPAKINDRWELMLPEFRERFHATRPWWEVGRVEHCAERMKPGMIVWDIGAEHGDFSALYAQWVRGCTDPYCPCQDGDACHYQTYGDSLAMSAPEGWHSGGVVLIEPSHGYWPCIRETFAANDLAPPVANFVGFASDATARPHDSAADIEERRATLDVGDGWPRCSIGPIIEDFGFRHLAQQTDSTPQIRIDDFARECGYPPDAIVMDIEGAEWHALRGLSGLEKLPLVWVSVHEPTMLAWYDKTLDDIHTLMTGFGYRDGVLLPAHGEGETFWFYEPR